MKRFFLLYVIMAGFVCAYSQAWAVDDKNADETLRKSELSDPYLSLDKCGYPLPFVRTGSPIINPDTLAAISTGYYFVDSNPNEKVGDPWKPNASVPINLAFESARWTKIYSGPNQFRSQAEFNAYVKSEKGYSYFRNPANTDSTDNAFAGPMPIQFEFYFNGLRYDSFYVSTNGLVFLTNGRYTYTTNASGVTTRSGYNKYSMDWFVDSRPKMMTNGRPDNAKAASDPIPDNFGYQYAVLGNDPATATAGIRVVPVLSGNAGQPGAVQDVAALNSTALFPPALKQAIIAPLFSDMQISVWDKANAVKDDYSSVWFKVSSLKDSLTIYYKNAIAANAKLDPNNFHNEMANRLVSTIGLDNRSGSTSFADISFSVVLSRLDSSVTFNYHSMNSSMWMNGRFTNPEGLWQYNSTIGVRGFARHVNWNRTAGIPAAYYPWAGEYEQYTHYNYEYDYKQLQLLAAQGTSGRSVKFKQWKNVFRVIDIQYRVQNPNPSAASGFNVTVPAAQADGYELLAGDERLGAIQPVVTYQNLSNDIQGPEGVNYVQQPLQFSATFAIVNLGTLRRINTSYISADSLGLANIIGVTDPPAYDDVNMKSKYVDASSTDGVTFTMAEKAFPGPNKLSGIPPYGFCQIFFSPFYPSENRIGQIGRLQGTVTLDNYRPGVQRIPLAEMWPFDNDKSIKFFSIRRIEGEFYDDGTQYHLIDNVNMPSTLKWVNYDAEMVDGENYCYYPLSPRGDFKPTNEADFGFVADDPTLYQSAISSPAILLNRVTLTGGEPAGYTMAANQLGSARTAYSPDAANGDDLRTFPIDMQNTSDRPTIGSAVSFSLQRGAKKEDGYDRKWSESTLINPEIRTIKQTDYNDDPTIGGRTFWNQYVNAVSVKFDMLCLEFASQKVDPTIGTQKVVNLSSDADWRWHASSYYAQPITDNSALSVYGGVGYQVGFDESNYNLPLKAADGIRCYAYDDGVDFGFRRFIVPIPDTIINAPLEGARNFRFRFKVRAWESKMCQQCITDDVDNFVVDNVKIVFPQETADIELSSAKILWPYTLAPASQAIAVPIEIKVANNSTSNARIFSVRVKIYKKGEETDTTNTRALYCQNKTIPDLEPGKEITIGMPRWDARGWGTGEYVIKAFVVYPGGDADNRNDTTSSNVKITLGDYFSYINGESNTTPAANDVPNEDDQNIDVGMGLIFPGWSQGGSGAYTAATTNGSFDQLCFGRGGCDADITGEIAMKFQLFVTDTIHGYSAHFGSKNLAGEDVSFELFKDAGAGTPSDTVGGSELIKSRGYDDITGTYKYDEYTNYNYSASNRSSIVLPPGTYWLGCVQRTLNGYMLGASKSRSGLRTTVFYVNPNTSARGDQNVTLYIDKNFRRTLPNGTMINDNFFAYRNGATSSSWREFVPSRGNIGYPRLDAAGSGGSVPNPTLSNGTWIPLLRPYFGKRTNNVVGTRQDCGFSAVTVYGFNGQGRNKSVDLFWNTSSEIDNKYFSIERKQADQDENSWKSIAMLNGAGNSSTAHSYTFNDVTVRPNTEYQYRLRAISADGKYDCQDYGIVEVTLNSSEITVSAGPNPFENMTTINVNTPVANDINVEVSDIFGNVVKSFNQHQVAGFVPFNWGGTDEGGNMVANGTYIYKVKVGDQTFTGKLSLVR